MTAITVQLSPEEMQRRELRRDEVARKPQVVVGTPAVLDRRGSTGKAALAILPSTLPLDASVIEGLRAVVMSLERIEKVLGELREIIPEPPRAREGQSSGLIRRIRVVTVDTPVQGPDIKIPPGYATVIRMRRHTGSPTGYFSFSRSDALDTTVRVELQDNDSYTLRVRNWDDLWFNATAANTDFELVVER